MEARGGHPLSWTWTHSCELLWRLGIELGALEEKPVLLTTEKFPATP